MTTILTDQPTSKIRRHLSVIVVSIIAALSVGLAVVGVVGVIESATAAQRTYQIEKFDNHVQAVRTAELERQEQDLQTIIVAIRATQINGHAILIQLKGDTANIAEFARVIERYLVAICTADRCVLKNPSG